MGGKSCKLDQFTDGKPCMKNFYIPDLQGFHDWENRTCPRNLLLNLFQTKKEEQMIYETKLTDLLDVKKFKYSEL